MIVPIKSFVLFFALVAMPSYAQPLTGENESGRASEHGPYQSLVRILPPGADINLQSKQNEVSQKWIARIQSELKAGDLSSAISLLENERRSTTTNLAKEDIEGKLIQVYVADQQFGSAIQLIAGKNIADFDDETRIAIALAYFKLRNEQQAVSWMRSIASPVTSWSEAWLEVASTIYCQARIHLSCIDLSARLVEMDIGEVNHWLRLSQSYRDHGDNYKAIATLELGYKMGVKFDYAIAKTLAAWLSEIELSAKSAALLEGMTDSYINDDFHFRSIAQYHFAAKQYQKAAIFFSKQGRTSRSAEDYFNAGQIYYRLDMPDAAIDQLNNASKQDGNFSARALLLMGQIYWQQGEPKKAKKIFERASNFGAGIYEPALQWITFLELEIERSN